MFDKERRSGPGARPAPSILHSDIGRDHEKSKQLVRVATGLVDEPRTSHSVKGSKSTKVKRSETLSSKPRLVRLPSVQTRYMEMLLHLDDIPRLDNILASLSTWVILAAFLTVPGTFTTFKDSKAFQDANKNDQDEITHAIIHSVAHVGLLWLSGASCVVGMIGCLGLWYRWRENYVWLINRVFLPVTMNSVAGLITTLVNIYTAQRGVWSITARITVIVIGSCLIMGGLLFACYNFWALRRVRKDHENELGLDAQHEDETLVEKVKRKVHEPPLQSGNMV